MQCTKAYGLNHLAIKDVAYPGTHYTMLKINAPVIKNEAMYLYMIVITVIKTIATEKGTEGPQTPSPS